MQHIEGIEAQRSQLQWELDSKKTQAERNEMGQFSTPFLLAKDILGHALTLLEGDVKVRFLDPAVGTGAFFSAFLDEFPSSRVNNAVGFEVDEHYALPARNLWKGKGLEFRIEDFTRASPPKEEHEKANLIICNPPYVRHHHIKNKDKLKKISEVSSTVKLSGLAGLYCYFITISHRWLAEGGLSGWLIPSEFMDVNYGLALKNYLLNQVTLLQIHRFDPSDLQFGDALVSSSVVWFKKAKPAKGHSVLFSYGGTLQKPTKVKEISNEVLEQERKWTRFPLLSSRKDNGELRLKDFFLIKRGIATGDNRFFVMSKEELESRNLPISEFRPILPSPRYLDTTEILSDLDGNPIVDRKLFLLDTRTEFDEIEKQFPTLYRYLEKGIDSGVNDRYLCKKRKPWYSQEKREAALFYCTYIGRSDTEGKKPFRFILNHSKAIVSNSYLMLYPNPTLIAKIENNPGIESKLQEALSRITDEALLSEGRVYGGGMHKLEPRELSNVPANELCEFVS